MHRRSTVGGKRGRFTAIRENLEIKEVVVGDGERRRRIILVHNPEEAGKDKATRERTLKKIDEALKSIKEQKGHCHKRNVCALLPHGTMGRYLRQLKTGAIKLAKGKIQEDAHLDGKYIISSSDDTLSPEDIALGYKQLMEVERAFRTLKTTLDLLAYLRLRRLQFSYSTDQTDSIHAFEYRSRYRPSFRQD
jgi:hypothetical protein